MSTVQSVRIGIAARRWDGSADARGARREAMCAMPAELAAGLAEAGALPLLFLPTTQSAIAAQADLFDALLLQGGADVDPALYGEPRDATAHAADAERDACEIALLHAFLARGKPVLGICRGCQLMNVAFGGTLYRDLPTQFGTTQAHSEPAVYVALEHDVELVDDGYLAGLYGRTRGRVNSAHRQGILRLAETLRAEARCASDGLVEAFRARDADYAVGVQWHPEFQHDCADTLLPRRTLFADFVAAAERARA